MFLACFLRLHCGQEEFLHPAEVVLHPAERAYRCIPRLPFHALKIKQ